MEPETQKHRQEGVEEEDEDEDELMPALLREHSVLLEAFAERMRREALSQEQRLLDIVSPRLTGSLADAESEVARAMEEQLRVEEENRDMAAKRELNRIRHSQIDEERQVDPPHARTLSLDLEEVQKTIVEDCRLSCHEMSTRMEEARQEHLRQLQERLHARRHLRRERQAREKAQCLSCHEELLETLVREQAMAEERLKKRQERQDQLDALAESKRDALVERFETLMATLISSTMLREDEEYLALELQAETADFIDRMRAAFEEEFKKMLDAMQVSLLTPDVREGVRLQEVKQQILEEFNQHHQALHERWIGEQREFFHRFKERVRLLQEKRRKFQKECAETPALMTPAGFHAQDINPFAQVSDLPPPTPEISEERALRELFLQEYSRTADLLEEHTRGFDMLGRQ